MTEINSYWVGDITYIHTGGWRYLAVVIDLYWLVLAKSGGLVTLETMTAEVKDGLLMAPWQRKPKTGLIWQE